MPFRSENEPRRTVVMNPIATLNRVIAREGVRRILPYEIIDENDTVAEVQRLQEKGVARIWTPNHFSNGDPLRVLAAGFDMGYLRAPTQAVTAEHQKSLGMQALVKFAGVETPYITTENSVESGKAKHGEGYGMMEYLDGLARIIQQNGSALVLPQGKREATLGEPTNAMGAIRLGMRKKEVEDGAYAMVFMGLGIKGYDGPYDIKRGFNPYVDYEIKVGGALTMEEAMKEAGGKARNLGGVVYEHMRPLMPPDY